MVKEYRQYKNLLVSEDGTDVINTKTENHLKIQVRQSTGEQYILFTDENKRMHSINMKNVVYRAFIGKYPSRFYVSHKDGNTSNNHYSNLELVLKKGKTVDLSKIKDNEKFITQFYTEYFVSGKITRKADTFMPSRKDFNHSIALDELFVAVSIFNGEGRIDEFCLQRIRWRLSSAYKNFKEEYTKDINELKEDVGDVKPLYDDTDEFVRGFCECLTNNQRDFLIAMYENPDLTLKEYARLNGVTPQSLSKVRKQIQKKYFKYLLNEEIIVESGHNTPVEIIVKDIDGTVFGIYESIMSASRHTGVHQSSIHRALLTGRPIKGLYFERREKSE